MTICTVRNILLSLQVIHAVLALLIISKMFSMTYSAINFSAFVTNRIICNADIIMTFNAGTFTMNGRFNIFCVYKKGNPFLIFSLVQFSILMT